MPRRLITSDRLITLARAGAGLAMALMLSGTAAKAATEILVESAPDGWNSEWYKSDGIWIESVGKSKAPGLVGTKSYFNTADATSGKATFSLEIPVEGNYEVFVTFSQTANSKDVIYNVTHGNGTEEVRMDQNGQSLDDRGPNRWISIGTFPFKAGGGQQVEITDPTTGLPANEVEPNIRIYADAIRLVPVGMALPGSFENKLAPGVTPPRAAQSPAAAVGEALAAARERAAASTPAPVPPSLSSLAPPPLPLSDANASPAGSIPPPLEPGLGAAAPSAAVDSGLPVLPGFGAIPESPAATVPSVSAPAAPVPPALTGAAAEPAPRTGVTNASGGLGLPANLPALSAAANPPVTAALPTSLQNVSVPLATPAATPSNTPLGLAPISSLGQAQGALPDLASATFGNAPASASRALPQAPARTPQPTPPPMEDDGTGIQWAFDYYASLGAARSQSRPVLVFFTARGNRVANRYTSEFFRDPVVRAALDRFILVKLDFPMNTRLAYRLGIFGAGQIAVVNSDDTKLGTVVQIPSNPSEFVAALDAIK